MTNRTETLSLPADETQFEYQKVARDGIEFDATGMTLEMVVRMCQCRVTQHMESLTARTYTWSDGGAFLREKLAQAGIEVPAERLAEIGLEAN